MVALLQEMPKWDDDEDDDEESTEVRKCFCYVQSTHTSIILESMFFHSPKWENITVERFYKKCRSILREYEEETTEIFM